METELIRAPGPDGDAPGLVRAAELLRAGGLVAFPTETVYGIGANALNPDAVAGIFRAKGRPADNPLIVHVISPEHIAPLVTEMPPLAHKLAEAFWPGPLTVILPKSGLVPDITSGGLATVAVRIPSHPVARELIRLTGVPVAAPSANVSGSPSPTTADHCLADLNGRVDMIVDGGPCGVGVESTVISLAGDGIRLLRPGAVTAEMLRHLARVEVDDAVLHRLERGRTASSPGMKYKHYAPAARITLVHGGDAAFYEFAARADKEAWFLAFEEDLEALSGRRAVAYGSGRDPDSQAKGLFSALRALDAGGAEAAFARAPGREGVGLAVYNRLLRAAAFREIYL